MEEKIHLKAAAKLVYQLGEQLIENELVALLELIKNSYDADATRVSVEVTTEEITEYGRGKIVIEDNGHGMIPSVLKNEFFKIATSFREENRYSFKYERQVLGQKGLGRLSFQRLGYFIRVITKPDKEILDKILTEKDRIEINEFENFELIIDWKMLDTKLNLDEVTATLKKQKENTLKNKFGTKIEILGIRNIEFWNKSEKETENLVKEIYKMSSPFLSDEKSLVTEGDFFKINFKLNNKRYRNDEIDEEILEKLYDNKIEFSFQELKLNVKIHYTQRYLLSVIDNVLSRLEKFNVLEKKLDLLKNYEFDEFEVNLLNTTNENKDFIKYIKKANLLSLNGEIANPGNFSGKIYNLRFGAKNQKLISNIIAESRLENIKEYKTFKSIWDSIRGFYVYRNSFRVLPYGNSNYDWAGFDSYTKERKYGPYEYKNIIGYINLDGLTCNNLKELTNRQGFILDEYGENFINIIKNILVYIVADREVELRKSFNINFKEKDNIVESKNKILKVEKIEDIKGIKEENHGVISEIKRIIESPIFSNEKYSGNTLVEKSTKSEKKELINLVQKVEKNIEKLSINIEQDKKILDLEKEEINSVIPMVGQSLIAESMTHEFHRIANNISGYANKTIEEIEKEKLEKKNIILWQQSILTEVIFLREQLAHIEPTYKKNRKIIERINLKDFLEKVYIEDSPMSRKAKSNNIKVIIQGEDINIEGNKGYLITIFDNLFLNSLYWLVFTGKEEKEIKISIFSNGKVIFEDNGVGISKKDKNSIFDPFFTLKPDGRGLGLYIVSSLLREMNAYIELKEEENFEGRYNQFLITFNNYNTIKTLF